MVDAVIVVAAIGALSTVTVGLGGSLGGYWLAARNDRARDARAAQQEETNRKAALAERLQDRRHDWQRDVLLELQDDLQKLTRVTVKILLQDLKTVREQGGFFRLPEELGGDESLAVTVAVQKLRSRTLADDLRALVGDFVNFCTFATTGVVLQHKGDPQDVLENVLTGLHAELGQRYEYLVEQLGVHIRRNEEPRQGPAQGRIGPGQGPRQVQIGPGQGPRQGQIGPG
jgi:glucose-6-phosphate-specific signal transduction histidine kinase